MTNLRFWVDGARTMGQCEARDCNGAMMVVEDMGPFVWCQCSTCLEQAGVHKTRLTPERNRALRDAGSEWSF